MNRAVKLLWRENNVINIQTQRVQYSNRQVQCNYKKNTQKCIFVMPNIPEIILIKLT